MAQRLILPVNKMRIERPRTDKIIGIRLLSTLGILVLITYPTHKQIPTITGMK